MLFFRVQSVLSHSLCCCCLDWIWLLRVRLPPAGSHQFPILEATQTPPRFLQSLPIRCHCWWMDRPSKDHSLMAMLFLKLCTRLAFNLTSRKYENLNCQELIDVPWLWFDFSEFQFMRSLPLFLIPLLMPVNMDMLYSLYAFCFYFYGVYLHSGHEFESLSAHNPYINTSFQVHTYFEIYFKQSYLYDST